MKGWEFYFFCLVIFVKNLLINVLVPNNAMHKLKRQYMNMYRAYNVTIKQTRLFNSTDGIKTIL